MKARISFIQISFTLIILLIIGVITANAQALKITPNANTAGANLNVKAETIFNYRGNADGFQVRTDSAPANHLPSQKDLIWVCFTQAQSQNPGIFGITSVSAAVGWTSCFQVRANGNVGIFNESPGAALEVGTSGNTRQIKVNGNIVLTSDERIKENIRDISNSLGKLKQLRSVSYNFKDENKEQPIPEKFLKNGIDIEKMKAELKSVPKTNQHLLGRNFYGFLAQDVQKLFPDLVFADSAGVLSVDYIGMIPLLVNGLKEQQSQIDELRSEIEKLKGTSIFDSSFRSSSNLTGTGGIDNTTIAECKLYQNAPNPFNQNTQIRYYIPQTVISAQLCIYDLQGKQIKQIQITQRGNGFQIISGSELTAGMYLYSLIVDGSEVDTKRMILTK